jgi:ribosomal protein S8E
VSLEIKVKEGEEKRETERKKDKTNLGSKRKERRIANERNDVWKGKGVDPFMWVVRKW